ncbi:NAC domain-containing protein 7 [Sesamum alatum]|uniref:NAC domain-containing protein 7 n=1 Tax=Sesamum alatum TaxID=300844 RepID=A0AAE2CVU3_9LAMI|nr:NAC domain-containing protein 7 [Sesamum alatum]
MESPKQHSYTNLPCNFAYTSSSCKKEMSCLQYGSIPHADNQFLQLPLLESPKLLQPPQLPFHMQSSQEHVHQTLDQSFQTVFRNNNNSEQLDDQVTDWRVLDKFVASQLSQEEITKETDAYQDSNMIARNSDKQEMAPENASTSSSSCQIDLWK